FRLAAALGGLALALGLERWRPLRGHPRSALPDDLRNLALWGAGALVVQALPFAGALGASELARLAGLGLFQRLALPGPLEIAATIVALDAGTYALHRLYHTVHPLWRLHRVHHSEERLTTTTGVRFHPGEVAVSALGRMALVVALGADLIAVVAFETLLLAASQLEHADVRLPAALDRRLRLVVITPSLHRTHHATHRALADSNFGTILSVWDRLFRSYRPQVRPEDVVVGLPDGGDAPASLGGLLAMPFVAERAERTRVARG
ncbi:MAG: sterol desaturase family protein, partial [Myxococcota bacterium]